VSDSDDESVKASVNASTKPKEREERINSLLDACPTSPGVYLMKNDQGHIIYVGKAKNLRNRVKSYFQNLAQASAKTQHLVSHIDDIEFFRAGTEIEALLLENTLIKKHKPKYNISLKDDKTYPYIRLDVGHEYPRPYIARKQIKGDSSEFFGPFPHSGAVGEIMRVAAKVFKIRDCRDNEFRNRSRPCLSYEIGQCTAPCVGLVSKDEYAAQIEEFRLFLKGQNLQLETRWSEEMEKAAEAMEYEKAAEWRDRIEIMNEVLGEKQRMVNTDDLGDRDVWALWPEPFLSNSRVEGQEAWNEGESLDVMVLQFRYGKLVGRMHWTGDLSEMVESDDILASVLLQHYQKNPSPEQIVIPPNSLSLSSHELALALGDLTVPREGGEAQASVSIHKADEREDWWASFELAKENVKGWHEEQRSLRLKQQDSLLKLQKLIALPKLPRWMECIDISNFQGAANVASCVVFVNGKPSKENYRHYKIKSFDGQNDFASMKELVSRRYGKPDSRMPDLLVVDGGKGQLASVLQIAEALELDFPIISLAKARTESNFSSEEIESSEERIFLPNQKNHKKIRDAGVLKLLTHIRDEAHRFAIEFHRKQLRKGLMASGIEEDD